MRGKGACDKPFTLRIKLARKPTDRPSCASALTWCETAEDRESELIGVSDGILQLLVAVMIRSCIQVDPRKVSKTACVRNR